MTLAELILVHTLKIIFQLNLCICKHVIRQCIYTIRCSFW